MAVEKINIERFLQLSQHYPVLDVRSPAEYIHAHIPGAQSFPLFSDEERKVVGTAYKQQSRETAIKIGLDFFGVKMRTMVEAAESQTLNQSTPGEGGRDPGKEGRDFASMDESAIFINGQARSRSRNSTGISDSKTSDGRTLKRTVLIHCWRGGMRSSAVAWLLDLYGFRVYTLAGGYKSFRQYISSIFPIPYHFAILGGFTGSGKTYVLAELQKQGHCMVNLEALANHRGSAFGAMGQQPQPTQEMFENILGLELKSKSAGAELQSGSGVHPRRIWLEDESQRIGALNIPSPLWKQMRESPVYFLDIPFEARLSHIEEEYGNLDREEIKNSIMRIRTRLGGLETKTAIASLLEDNLRECFRILLRYYDKYYLRGLQRRQGYPDLVKTIRCESVETGKNAGQLLIADGIKITYPVN